MESGGGGRDMRARGARQQHLQNDRGEHRADRIVDDRFPLKQRRRALLQPVLAQQR